jgi:NADH-quinone oxidoreductase subunit N
MTVMGLTLADLSTLAPELTLVITAIVLSIIDLFMPANARRHMLGWLAILGLIISALFTIRGLNPDQVVTILDMSYRVDDFSSILKLFILVATALIILMSIGSLTRQHIIHKGEYYYLLLPAAVGAMIMVSSADLITLFVGLELLSITSYILVAMNKRSGRSTEAAFKYVVQGGIASAFILYGMSFLYGISGSTNLQEIRQAILDNAEIYSPLIYLSFFLLLAGFGFKIAAAPFHAWAPDVYQGSSSPVAAFLAVVSKAAAIALLLRITVNVYIYAGQGSSVAPIFEDVFFAIQVLAAIAIIVGNVMALRQTNVKRLLAYSGIANSGYILVALPITADFNLIDLNNVSELIFYLVAYLLMNIGIFAVLMAVSQANHEDENNEEMSAFAGLYYRAPWTAVATVLLVLSLAGLPISAGFIGKMYILFGTMQEQAFWLAAIMIIGSIISFFYYFGFIRQMFMRSNEQEPIYFSWPLQIVIWICTILTFALGIYPNIIIEFTHSTYQFLQDLIT